MTMSAPSSGARSSIRTLLPGTASSLRCRRVFFGLTGFLLDSGPAKAAVKPRRAKKSS